MTGLLENSMRKAANRSVSRSQGMRSKKRTMHEILRQCHEKLPGSQAETQEYLLERVGSRLMSHHYKTNSSKAHAQEPNCKHLKGSWFHKTVLGCLGAPPPPARETRNPFT
ncbi:hypothetical protein LEMLEM_LOCUS1847 [Lemmus lemmus]